MRALASSERRPPRKGARLAGLLFAASVVVGPQALAQSANDTGVPEPAATSAPALKGLHEAVGRLSKFEARKIRHACQGRANERGLSGAEREAFLSKCYFGRVAHREVRHECHQQGVAKGLDKTALRDFVRECVKERTRQ